MRRNLVVGGVLLLTLATGFAFGYGFSRLSANAPAGRVDPDSPPRETAGYVRPYKLRDPNYAKSEAFIYPGAKSVTSFTGGGHSDPRGLHFSGITSANLVTPDDFGKVVAFYVDRLKITDTGEGPGTSQRITAEQGVMLIDDCRVYSRMFDHGRPMELKCFALRTFPYDVVVIVSRGQEEKETHIMLVYHPNDAWVKGQKSDP